MTYSPAGPKAVFQTVQPLVLASASPRRKRLLESVGLRFDVLPSGVEEVNGSGGTPLELVEGWARDKAYEISRQVPQSWVLAADTIVVLGNTVFGKPADREEAISMLRRLSGRDHHVITAMCLVRGEPEYVGVKSVNTGVRFKPLSDEEILAYVHTGEPMDKAGAYGIQGIGAFLVESIRGSYTNVVGLPLGEILDWLLDLGVIETVKE